MKKYKSIVFCSADPTKNAGNLREYFQENSEVFTAFHFFPGYVKRVTYIFQYKNGKKVLEKKLTLRFSSNTIFKNISDYLFFSYMLIVLVPRNSFLITNAPIYCAFSFFFKALKSIKYVLRIDDYYPDNSLSIRIYNFYVEYLNKSLPYVLYISPPLFKKFAGKRGKNKFKRLISLGIKRNFTERQTKHKSELVLGFIGIIRKQQGLDLVFNYLAISKNIRLEVIGSGYFENYYKKLAKEMGISKKVKFYGIVEDVKPIFAKWDIGLALYVNSKDNLSRFCEPTKLKDYLSNGLPVVTTRTTYFHAEIEQQKAGEIIQESTKSLGDALERIKNNYTSYLSGVDKINEKYSYKDWYDDKFDFLG